MKADRKLDIARRALARIGGVKRADGSRLYYEWPDGAPAPFEAQRIAQEALEVIGYAELESTPPEGNPDSPHRRRRPR